MHATVHMRHHCTGSHYLRSLTYKMQRSEENDVDKMQRSEENDDDKNRKASERAKNERKNVPTDTRRSVSEDEIGGPTNADTPRLYT